MLVNYRGNAVPLISATFWENEEINYSDFSKEHIIKISENTIMPFLYNENDVKRYWKEYYEMTDGIDLRHY